MKEPGKTASIHRFSARAVIPYLFVAPFMLMFLVFGLVPLVMSIVISFTKWDYASPMEWYGLGNYKLIFGLIGSGKVASDFWSGVMHTLLFVAVETQKGFIVDDFSAIGYNSGDLPQTPFFPHPHYMYRGLGLALDGVAVRNILENGLQVKDVGPDHNTRRLAYASHMGRGALQAIARQPVINLSNSPTVAIYYAKRYQAKGMLVLVVVKAMGMASSISLIFCTASTPVMPSM